MRASDDQTTFTAASPPPKPIFSITESLGVFIFHSLRPMDEELRGQIEETIRKGFVR